MKMKILLASASYSQTILWAKFNPERVETSRAQVALAKVTTVRMLMKSSQWTSTDSTHVS
jgi:hypothetical protein